MTKCRKERLERETSNHSWYTCKECGGKFRKSEIDVDHIIPQAIIPDRFGIKHHHINTQILCQHCNRSKQDKIDVRTAKAFGQKGVDETANLVPVSDIVETGTKVLAFGYQLIKTLKNQRPGSE